MCPITKTKPLRTLVYLALVSVLSGCNTTPSRVELPVLHRYQATDNYGALSVQFGDSEVPSPETSDFITWANTYAVDRGIKLVTEAEALATDSRILIKPDKDGIYQASLFRGGQALDQINIRALDQYHAQLIIDEMLLLWHPPRTGKSARSSVPAYALAPVSHEVSKQAFLGLMSGDTKNMNMGHQAWYQLESRTPTFNWEAFPREWDIPEGFSKEDFKNVRYEFLIGPARSLFVGFISVDSEAVVQTGLVEPQFTVKEKMPFCRQYMWTVRAVFELNGVIRHTEWAEAYQIYPSIQEKPWYFRRKLPSGLAAYSNPAAYYFAVRTPKNPFAEECVYQ